MASAKHALSFGTLPALIRTDSTRPALRAVHPGEPKWDQAAWSRNLGSRFCLFLGNQIGIARRNEAVARNSDQEVGRNGGYTLANSLEICNRVFLAFGHVGLPHCLSSTTVATKPLITNCLHALPIGAFQLSLSNHQIATRIGSVRDVVSRALTRLQHEGLIAIEGRTITIPDIRALKFYSK